MNMRFTRSGLAATVAAAVLALAGCGGGGGSDDTPPVVTPPVVTPPVAVPTGTSPITLTANTPPATFAALEPVITVGRVTIASPPVVDFSMTDADGNAIIGFGSTSQSATATVASYPNVAFSLAKLVPGTDGAPSKWVSYIVTTVPTTTSPNPAPTRPSTDNTGTLVDHGNGTYTYTFYRDITTVKDQVAAMTVAAPNNKDDLGDLTYDPNLVHRLTMQVSGNAPGTGTNTATAVQATPGVPMTNPVDVIYDFVPATGAAVESGREIAATSKCDECHRRLGGIPGESSASSAAGFHGGARNEVRYCVVCHTEQRRYGRTEATFDTSTMSFTSSTTKVDDRAVGNLPNFIHKTHMGHNLSKHNYNYGGVEFNHVGYPQDIKNCTKCHDGSDTSTAKTAQGDNWKNVPSRLACGSCHDGINFATGKGVTIADAQAGLTTSTYGHVGGAQANDKLCALCHTSTGIDLNHLPITAPNPENSLLAGMTNSNTNAAWIASNTSRLPAGAIKVTHEIKSVSLNASSQPVMVFRLLQDGVAKTFNDPTAKTEIWDGFMGAPSLYFVYSVPQDGIAAPTDFNASSSVYLRSLWNGTATGTLSAPDAEGYYTATLTGVTIPASAKMLTGGVGYSYNVKSSLPLTQTNLADYPVTAATGSGLTAGMPNMTGGLIVVSPNVQKVADGFTGRRAIVADARCNACHQELGTFTVDSFHGGQRNDGTTCSWCHNPNRASSGWTADSTNFVHAIHAGAKRTVPYTWHAISETDNYSEIGYPGVLRQCETCHLPGTYDFSAAASSSALPNRQYRTVATGTFSSTANALSLFQRSPYVTDDLAYGSGFSFNAGTGVTTEAAATTLVISPITTTCISCHDSDLARSHMVTNGGSFYVPRSQALATSEQCMLCHASGKVADIAVMHAR